MIPGENKPALDAAVRRFPTLLATARGWEWQLLATACGWEWHGTPEAEITIVVARYSSAIRDEYRRIVAQERGA